MTGGTVQPAGPYGLHNVSGDEGSEAEALDTPLMRVDEAVRMALIPDPASNSGENRDPVGAERGDLSVSVDDVQFGIGAVSFVNAPPKLLHATAATTFIALQEWEGHVLEIGGDEFVAALIDLTADSSHEEEEAIIPLTEISDHDAATLRVGAIFRWVIGYERSPSGTKKRVSQIVFRDLPRITDRDLIKARSGHARQDGHSSCDGRGQSPKGRRV